MIFEAVRIRKMDPPLGHSLISPFLDDEMVDRAEGAYDGDIAVALAVASVYAYADIDTFARKMFVLGFRVGTEIVGITYTIPELFVTAKAYLVQSADKRLAILVFRGTEMTNISNWLADVSAHTSRYAEGSFDIKLFKESVGWIHGGFLDILFEMAHSIGPLLKHALKGYPICAAAVREKVRVQDYMKEAWWLGGMSQPVTEGEKGLDVLGHLPPLPPYNPADTLEALYIAGHSLGGALAVVAAAALAEFHLEATLELGVSLYPKEKLRGIYTYGQPMVGDERFAELAQQSFAYKVFRHIYRTDVIPRLPPRTMGKLVHVGHEFTSSDKGWVYRSGAVSQVCTGVGAAVLGLSAAAQKQLAGIPALQRLHLPYSLADHEPSNYLRTSMVQAQLLAEAP